MENDRQDWVSEVFPNINDPYDKVWHNKLVFMPVQNGDYIAFDLEDENDDKRVVYLSHDDGEGHGYILGENFKDFMDRYIRTCCCGLEDWQMISFMKNSTDGILPDSENAVLIRKILGVTFE